MQPQTKKSISGDGAVYFPTRFAYRARYTDRKMCTGWDDYDHERMEKCPESGKKDELGANFPPAQESTAPGGGGALPPLCRPEQGSGAGELPALLPGLDGGGGNRHGGDSRPGGFTAGLRGLFAHCPGPALLRRRDSGVHPGPVLPGAEALPPGLVLGLLLRPDCGPHGLCLPGRRGVER